MQTQSAVCSASIVHAVHAFAFHDFITVREHVGRPCSCATSAVPSTGTSVPDWPHFVYDTDFGCRERMPDLGPQRTRPQAGPATSTTPRSTGRSRRHPFAPGSGGHDLPVPRSARLRRPKTCVGRTRGQGGRRRIHRGHPRPSVSNGMGLARRRWLIADLEGDPGRLPIHRAEDRDPGANGHDNRERLCSAAMELARQTGIEPDEGWAACEASSCSVYPQSSGTRTTT